MTLSTTTRTRLETQLDALPIFVDNLDAATLIQRPPLRRWSILENAAHLGRYHEVFRARMERILDEEGPNLGRYSAEDDPEFADWLARSPDDVLSGLSERRADLIEFVDDLEDAQFGRTGSHTILSETNVSLWLEFFLLHEAHHLYRILWLSKTGE